MKDMTRIRGGAILARALKEKGVDHVFTLSGGFCNPALEGMMECQIPVINTPHEQVAGHLADGHTRITRKPAVCFVGPEGFANAVPAMMEALGERSPILFITSSSTLKRENAGGFKEIDDVAIAAPLVKYSVQVRDGARIGEYVDRAWTMATSGYPGAVHLSVPVDIMFSSFPEDAGREERPLDHGARPPARAWPEPAALDRVLAQVRAAERPVIIAGHSVWWSGGEKALEAAARALRLPVYGQPGHRKLMGEDAEPWMGLADFHQYPPSKPAITESDLVLVIGGKLDNTLNFGNAPFFPASTRVICINGSNEELEFNRPADELLLSDPGAFCEALAGIGRAWPQWFDQQRARRGAWVEQWENDLAAETAKEAGAKVHPLDLALEVQRAMGPRDWLIFDGGNTHFWTEIAVNMIGWRGGRLAGMLNPGINSMLGCGVPFAMSAKNLDRGSNVVLISGDGAFLAGGLSIETCFQEGLPITVVIDNNGGLDAISQQQERLFKNGQHFATDFRDIPFHRMVEGLGGYGELVTRREDIAAAVKRGIASGKPACINVKTRGVISPIIAATSDKRDKASIE
ncbi:thiamine pyrophosphate-binding protein [Antarcticimicrobium luteum]|uniref:Thiamine pyrophosphate-binding protein n=1 Tax=Antarcticimicrobium luteum TaxID=2547397 RepID=A0A4R5V1X0_9RHOB|nr:thiamine pyrophosphate-binding protein [Antarcticimicrobium luteum]TDK45601.1 thiamine pyrophosphate-binding protein [Antarcticimicrobium luteum]